MVDHVEQDWYFTLGGMTDDDVVVSSSLNNAVYSSRPSRPSKVTRVEPHSALKKSLSLAQKRRGRQIDVSNVLECFSAPLQQQTFQNGITKKERTCPLYKLVVVASACLLLRQTNWHWKQYERKLE